MSIFGSRQEKPDYLSKTHPLMIEAWAKQGMVMDLKTGEPVLLSTLTRRQQFDLFFDYDDYRDEKGTTISKAKRYAINIVCVAVDKNRDWQLETPPPTAPEPTPWPEKLAAMKEDKERFLNRLGSGLNL